MKSRWLTVIGVVASRVAIAGPGALAACGGAPAPTTSAPSSLVTGTIAPSPPVVVPLDAGDAPSADRLPSIEAGSDDVPIVRAGSGVTWLAVMQVLDRLKRSGRSRFVLATADGGERPSQVIEFPKPSTREASQISVDIVTLRADGTSMAVDAEDVSGVEELEKRLRARAPDAVVVRADSMAPFGRVLAIVNLAQRNGRPVMFGLGPLPPTPEVSTKSAP